MSPAKWEAEYTIEHTGTGLYWVSFRERRYVSEYVYFPQDKRYIEAYKLLYPTIARHRTVYTTMDAAEYGAKRHAKEQNEKLLEGTVAKELGKLP